MTPFMWAKQSSIQLNAALWWIAKQLLTFKINNHTKKSYKKRGDANCVTSFFIVVLFYEKRVLVKLDTMHLFAEELANFH